MVPPYVCRLSGMRFSKSTGDALPSSGWYTSRYQNTFPYTLPAACVCVHQYHHAMDGSATAAKIASCCQRFSSASHPSAATTIGIAAVRVR